MSEDTLKKALQGDINAFQELFAAFQNQLKSYLYRLVTDRNDAEDLTHDTFIKAYDKISTFRGDSSLRTWVFTIATHLALDLMRKRRRWPVNNQDTTAHFAQANQPLRQQLFMVHENSPAGAYEIREHIDYCFTCISKSLPIEQQVALILKDMYDFSVAEISLIMNKSAGVIKHLLIDARKTLTTVFENRCALINKNGTCHQCSQLNGLYNPKQDQQEALMKVELHNASKKFNREELFELRTRLVKAIDPLRASGTDLHDMMLTVTKMAIGESEA
jgi:RNA polymerase sigma-70 factor (ECF subfamily)